MKLPEHFPDNELVAIIKQLDNYESIDLLNINIIDCQTYPLICGILIKSYSGLKRIIKRCLIPPSITISNIPNDSRLEQIRLQALIYQYTNIEDRLILHNYYPIDTLYDTVVELSKKMLLLSPKLLNELYYHPLYPRHEANKLLIFNSDFIVKVNDFHKSVKRPDGTYELNDTIEVNENVYSIQYLAQLERENCIQCGSKRHLYCGSCNGQRTQSAEIYLPDRIKLPFDLLIIFHWQENLNKCTGIHANVLCDDSNISHKFWPRTSRGGSYADIIESLDPDNDVLLFPHEDAVLTNDFNWSSNKNTMKRLIILEASWNHGKTMATQIINYRKDHNLPAIPMVSLHDVTGKYWRFHREGSNALSTIEAITYTALSVTNDSNIFNHLLLLFEVQKYRVLKNIELTGKIPQAIQVQGSGIGSWENIEIIN